MNNKGINVMAAKREYFCMSYVQRTYGMTSSCQQ